MSKHLLHHLRPNQPLNLSLNELVGTVIVTVSISTSFSCFRRPRIFTLEILR